MKFSLFVHMQRGAAAASNESLYEEFISLCALADAGGMHAIWSGEHHAMDFTVAPNPFTTAVDLARRFGNVRVGTGTIVAPFWHPIKLAGEAAMADIITGGRLEVGIARGAYEYEYERLMPGMDAFEAGRRMREIIPAVQKLWAGDYAHDGEFYRFPKTTAAPRPKNPPPLWVAARDSGSHEFAVGGGCNVQVTPLWLGAEEAESLMNKFNDACKKFAVRPKIMLLHHVFVGGEKDMEMAARGLSDFYCRFGAWFQNKRPVKMGAMKPLSKPEKTAMKQYSPAAMQQNQVAGDAAEVIARLRRYEDLGYDEFAYWMDSDISYELKRASLNRFLDEVMPAFL
ncbi:MAG: LLM class flavin-dependent oxidoreductase [Betaproteobacteria bacterium]|nr:LLM class flavin-dependent oxidoreductase [Betaproteobacteria bacterium]